MSSSAASAASPPLEVDPAAQGEDAARPEAPSPPTKEALRHRRKHDVPGTTIRPDKVTLRDRLVRRLTTEPYPEGIERPRTRADCEGGPRPCPFVSCHHHLYIDVSAAGGLKLNFPDLEVWEMHETCALDVADRGGATLDEVGSFINLTREGARQIEDRALEKLKDLGGGLSFQPYRDDVRTRGERRIRLPVLRDLDADERDALDALEAAGDGDLGELVDGTCAEEPLG
jgi:hypothetical protein